MLARTRPARPIPVAGLEDRFAPKDVRIADVNASRTRSRRRARTPGDRSPCTRPTFAKPLSPAPAPSPHCARTVLPDRTPPPDRTSSIIAPATPIKTEEDGMTHPARWRACPLRRTGDRGIGRMVAGQVPHPPGHDHRPPGRRRRERRHRAHRGPEAHRAERPAVPGRENGAGGNIGIASVSRAKPDGYTVLITADSAYVINPSLYRSTGFDPVKEFDPVATVATSGYVLVANKDFPPNNVAELIAAAKAQPGKVADRIRRRRDGEPPRRRDAQQGRGHRPHARAVQGRGRRGERPRRRTGAGLRAEPALLDLVHPQRPDQGARRGRTRSASARCPMPRRSATR